MNSRALTFDFERTYASRRRDVVRFLVSFGLAAEDAEDVAQDVFLRALALSPQAATPRNPFRWLLACAKNLAINQHHKAKREIAVHPETWRLWEASVPSQEPSAEVHLLRDDRLQKVRCALNETLRPLERDCLVLRGRGCTYRQIAERLDISLDRAIYYTGAAIDKVHRNIGDAL